MAAAFLLLGACD